ncbi:MAG: SUF system NifU family Fe-S cluster assembly protein [Planctomycetes bacterium]|nr:SUF system NifU family Fe-S cluster assembly protein [Planctomycetota bacterium]
MNDPRDLYQQLILDHNRSPKNRRVMEDADSHAEGFNPLCGDRITVSIKLDNDVVTDVAFQGSGCAISTASASLMTESLKGKTLAEAQALFARFRAMVMGEAASACEDGPALGKLEVFSGVCEFPARVKCATLAWHTVKAAIERRDEVVSTE